MDNHRWADRWNGRDSKAEVPAPTPARTSTWNTANTSASTIAPKHTPESAVAATLPKKSEDDEKHLLPHQRSTKPKLHVSPEKDEQHLLPHQRSTKPKPQPQPQDSSDKDEKHLLPHQRSTKPNLPGPALSQQTTAVSNTGIDGLKKKEEVHASYNPETRRPLANPTMTPNRPQPPAMPVEPLPHQRTAAIPLHLPRTGPSLQSTHREAPSMPPHFAEQQARVKRAADEAARAKANQEAEDAKLKQMQQQMEAQLQNFNQKEFETSLDDKLIHSDDQAPRSEQKATVQSRTPAEAEQKPVQNQPEWPSPVSQEPWPALEEPLPAPEEEAWPPVPEEAWPVAEPNIQQHCSLSQALAENNQPVFVPASPYPKLTLNPPTPEDSGAELGSCPRKGPENDEYLSNISTAGVENVNDSSKFASPDPRGNCLDDLSAEQDWNETRRAKPPKQADDAHSDSTHSDVQVIVPGKLQKFIAWWVAAIPEVKSDFLKRGITRHEDCDVDTCTGTLIKPVDYPKTIRGPDAEWEKFNHTTQDLVVHAIQAEKARRDRISRKQKPAKASRDANPQREEDKVTNPNQVQVDCHIRPATAEDMEGVAAIYNKEVDGSHTVTDTEPISAVKFRTLLAACKAFQQPFVVAVAGWHYPQAPQQKESIIGFCLVDTLGKGIMGSRKSLSAFCGKIFLIVHPDWRRKKVGTALMDVVMTSCSTRHTCKQGYQWVCPPADTTHVKPSSNSRKWYNLQMEVLAKSNNGEEDARTREEIQWKVDFLKAKFGFSLAHHDTHFYRHPNARVGESQNHWLDRLTLEHRCRHHNH